MKKIMFSDILEFPLMVMNGDKTMTRRNVVCPKKWKGKQVNGFEVCSNARGEQYTYLTDEDGNEIEGSSLIPTWKVGEIVAVAMRYSNCFTYNEQIRNIPQNHKGWRNKMYVKAELMPLHIKIKRVWIERLQSISSDDCEKEGVFKFCAGKWGFYDPLHNAMIAKNTPQEGYGAMIDFLMGESTWKRNPWVWCYEFELVEKIKDYGNNVFAIIPDKKDEPNEP